MILFLKYFLFNCNFIIGDSVLFMLSNSNEWYFISLFLFYLSFVEKWVNKYERENIPKFTSFYIIN